MSFFRILTGEEYNKASIKDTDFEQFYPSINANMKWKSLEPYARQAEECYIVPWISEAYYQELSLHYNTLPIAGVQKLCTPTNSVKFVTEIPAKDLVFYYLRCASAYYTIYQAMPHININIGDAGINEAAPDNMAGVRQWAYKNARWDALIKGYEFLDKAIALMEIEIEKTPGLCFVKYYKSDAYSVSKELFIPNATTLSKYVNIKGSRRAYCSMRPYIQKAESLYLRSLLGSDFYAELKVQIVDIETLTAENKKVLPYLEAFLAECTVVEATPEINLYNAGDGWKVLETTDGMTMSKEAQSNNVQHIVTKAKQNITYFRAELEHFLYNNLDDYPTFRDDTSANKDHDDNTSDYDEDAPHEGAAFL